MNAACQHGDEPCSIEAEIPVDLPSLVLGRSVCTTLFQAFLSRTPSSFRMYIINHFRGSRATYQMIDLAGGDDQGQTHTILMSQDRECILRQSQMSHPRRVCARACSYVAVYRGVKGNVPDDGPTVDRQHPMGTAHMLV
jgi:hypothetical protein